MNFDSFDFAGECRDEENPELHFYYNREDRIAHAPKIVQDFYNGTGPQVEKNLFKWLVKTPFSRVILITVVGIAAFTFILSQSMPDSWEKKVGDTTASLTAFSYIDDVYVAVTFSPNKKTRARGEKVLPKNSHAIPITVIFSTLDENNNVISTDRFLESYNGEEISVRTQFTDYDIIKVTAEVSVAGETETLLRKVEKH